MGRDNGCARCGAHREVVGIGEPADVVADDGAGLERGASDGGAPCVHRQRNLEARVQCLDGRKHPLELLLLADLRTRSGLDAPYVEHVGAVTHERVGLAEEAVEVEVAALVEEGIRGAVEDAEHDDPGGDVEGCAAQVEVHRGEPTPGFRERCRPPDSSAAPSRRKRAWG